MKVFYLFSLLLSISYISLYKPDIATPLDVPEIPLALNFREPVGGINGGGYYSAQDFGENNHYGEDWNGVGGGNSDYGDTIFAIGNGLVSRAKNYKGGWGNVITLLHKAIDGDTLESLYAHCAEILVDKNTIVKYGEPIALIGDANGQYLAHLHFEIRTKINEPIGSGYGQNKRGIYINPRKIIR